MSNSHAKRKRDHLRICLEEDVRVYDITTGLERYQLVHCALPELNLDEIDLRTQFLGKTLQAPLLISAMTGGTSIARQINCNLAEAAEALGIAMSVGSQRAAIEKPRLASTYQVRKVAPHILLFANLGAVQLNYGYGLDECRRAVDMIQADALMLHLNPLQEALQPEGNTNFARLLDKIALICRDLGVPVVVKEVGHGISEAVARQLAAAGVAAIDVAGAGGTAWSQVEQHRAQTDLQFRVAAAFARWGIPTAEAIRQVRCALPNLPLIASGGIWNGLDIAVALALGADLVGMARRLLEPACISAQTVQDELQVLITSLRVAMFAAGLRDIPALKTAPLMQRTSLDHYPVDE
nr:type 2 isopentenyl-diphosphate Delta-isomerase [Chloroflexota bacterium]